MNKRVLSLIIILGLIFSLPLKAQSLDETLSNLSSTVGTAYVKPVISAFGSNLNSGWVSRIPAATTLGFSLDLKIVAMGSFFSDDVKNFTATDQFYFDQSQTNDILANQSPPIHPGDPSYQAAYDQIYGQLFTVTFSGPTIVGSKNDYLKIQFPGKTISSGSTSYTIKPYSVDVKEVKGFLDEIPALPTAAAQLTVGTVFGTNVSIRYLPDVDIKDLGKFSYFGAGLVHNFGVWFPNPLPLDLAVGFFTQKLKVGSIFESTATQFGIYAAKTFGFGISITPYVGLTSETSETTVSYDYTVTVSDGVQQDGTARFDLEGENSSSAVIGFNLHLGVININADYKFAKTETVSAGISFGF